MLPGARSRSSLLVVLVAWLAASCGDGAPTLEKIQRRGTVRVGYANEAPYGYLDSETGKITGEAPSIARVILENLGVERMEPVVAEFGALIPGLLAGRFDVIAAGMYITPERCSQIRFSDPTYRIGEAFIVARDNPLDLHSFEDIAAVEAELGVVGGTVEHGYARDVGVPEDRIHLFPSNATALDAVRSGRIDAFAATVLTVNDLLRKADDPAIARAEPFHDPVIDGEEQRGYGAFGFRKADTELVEAFNRELDAFLGTEEHLELVRPFGFGESTLPGDVRASELCGGAQ